MSLSFLFFMERVGLTDIYFERVAESLVVTRSEHSSLQRLSEKGFFSSERVDNMLSKGWLQVAPKATPTRDIKETAHPSIQGSLAAYRKLDAKFLITEDPILRARAEAAGMGVVSTPEVIFDMAKKGAIDKVTALRAISGLQLLGWHEAQVLEQIKETIRCLYVGRK